MSRAWDRPYLSSPGGIHQNFEESLPNDPMERDHVLGVMRSARDQEEVEIKSLQQNKQVLNLVLSRIKKSIGRTPDMPIKDGVRVTEYMLSLAVKDGEVHLVLGMRFPGEGMQVGRLTGGDVEGGNPIYITCTCGLDSPVSAAYRRGGMRRTRLWLFQRAVHALASNPTSKSFVQLHT